MSAVLAAGDLVSAYGIGVDAAWNGLLGSRSAFSPVTRFPTAGFIASHAAQVPGLRDEAPESRVAQMLRLLQPRLPAALDPSTQLLLATTTGEIDLLERAVASGCGDAEESRPERLLARLAAALGLRARARVVSSACASSTLALALAAEEVARDPAAACLVIACDAVTEFVFAGFSTLMALDPHGARPFDRGRRGLTLGEGAAFALVMEEARARRAGFRPLARLIGWGASCDANHMTGPAQDGSGLARAIRQSLAVAGRAPDAIGSICAHGTGTPYNDAMELKAFRAALPGCSPPTYSVKGGLGHTLGAAGLIEALLVAASLRTDIAPPTVGLQGIDPEAAGLVRAAAAPIASHTALTTNSGFGGVNAALVLEPAEGD